MVEPEIPKYYANKKVLVTGGTGYMGKVIIWKLLRSCPLIGTIYVLIRSKYGVSPYSRKEDLFGHEIFDEFKKSNSQMLEKVVFIAGDVGEEELGLSEKDRNLLVDEVSVVFHGAAVLKMDADLKKAVNINTVGTLRTLGLAEKMKKLEAFVYISTAYCCCENESVEEKIYPAKHNPYDIIDLVRWMDPEILEVITPKLIAPLPNTYTYSKRLTESLLNDFKSKLPLILARPTIVIPSIQEPIPGWVDNLNGPVALFVAGGIGIMRTTMSGKNTKPNVIAVDIAVNGILVLPWANRRENLLKEPAVYNIGETEHEPLDWKQYTDLAINGFYKHPLKKSVWAPPEDPFTNSIVVYTVKSIFFHWLPAYVIDFILLLIGQKPFLVRVQTKIQQGENVLRYFARRQWSFANENLLQINKTMSEADKQIYPVTMKAITDNQAYLTNMILIAKTKLLKENLFGTKFHLRKAQILYYIDKSVTFLRYILFVKILVWLTYAILDIFQTYQRQRQSAESSFVDPY